ncbi:MAG: dihydroorotate dehydrogenase (quinone) [Legionellaceae bacterium]|nr:dihydroorotate dehydrogenase (quinone) [Legionellaceae bacterium]
MPYRLLRALLFCLEAERAHALALNALPYCPAFVFPRLPAKPRQLMGLTFRHPVGLAAGLDKNGQYVNGLAKLGFSFIEVGTVTPRPQSGNPRPRLFRLSEEEALINRMGFNNQGVDALQNHLAQRTYPGVLGINIGKNKDTPLASAAEDYCLAMQSVYGLADYITINISSPNTPNLRRLQEAEFLHQLLDAIAGKRQELTERTQRHVPLAIKISPDESDEQLKLLADTIAAKGMEAIIATNTTAARDLRYPTVMSREQGGLSGRPLRERANACMQLLRFQLGSSLVLIGAGGIDSPDAARERLASGADLLQLYTGLIYQGPALLSKIVRSLD